MTEGDTVAAHREPPVQTMRPQVPSWLWLSLLAAVCCAVLLLFYGNVYSVHQDFAGSALSAKLAVELGSYAREYILYFPPAERIWFSLAVHMSETTGMRLDLAAVLITTLAVFASVGMAYRIRLQTVGATPLFMVVPAAILIVFPILYKNVFGLREHMVALGVWPYVVLRMSDPEGRRVAWPLRASVGAWLGAMLLFKYLYCVVVALVELIDALCQRRPVLLFRIENLISAGIVALYLLLWLGIDPEQRAAISAMFSAIDAALITPETNFINIVFAAYFSAFFLITYYVFNVPGRTILLGLALVTGSIIVSSVQERWFSHHLFPITLSYIAWWWMAAPHFRWWGHVVVPIYLVTPVWTQFTSTLRYQRAVDELDAAMASAGISVGGKRVGLLTMHPSPYNQYLAARGALRWNALMNNAYISSELQWFDRKENAGEAPPPVVITNPGRLMLHDEMLRLWEDHPPDVVVLDQGIRWPLRYIDVRWGHIFSKDPRFNAIMNQYRPVFEHDGGRVAFRYYVRRDRFAVSRKTSGSIATEPRSE